jgi:hypothetical protein
MPEAIYDPTECNNPEDITQSSWLFQNTSVLISKTSDLLDLVMLG